MSVIGSVSRKNELAVVQEFRATIIQADIRLRKKSHKTTRESQRPCHTSRVIFAPSALAVQNVPRLMHALHKSDTLGHRDLSLTNGPNERIVNINVNDLRMFHEYRLKPVAYPECYCHRYGQTANWSR